MTRISRLHSRFDVGIPKLRNTITDFLHSLGYLFGLKREDYREGACAPGRGPSSGVRPHVKLRKRRVRTQSVETPWRRLRSRVGIRVPSKCSWVPIRRTSRCTGGCAHCARAIHNSGGVCRAHAGRVRIVHKHGATGRNVRERVVNGRFEAVAKKRATWRAIGPTVALVLPSATDNDL